MAIDIARLIESGIELPRGVAFTQLPEETTGSLDILLGESLKDLNPLTSVWYHPRQYFNYLERWRFWSGEVLAYFARKAELYRQLATENGSAYGEEFQTGENRLRATVTGTQFLRSVHLQNTTSSGYERLLIVMTEDQIADRSDSPEVKCTFLDQKTGQSSIYKLTFLGARIARFGVDLHSGLDQDIPTSLSFDLTLQAREDMRNLAVS